jgi:hypothetical protein
MAIPMANTNKGGQTWTMTSGLTVRLRLLVEDWEAGLSISQICNGMRFYRLMTAKHMLHSAPDQGKITSSGDS